MSAVGTRLRFFSERVFGVWVEAVVVAASPKRVTLRANFHGAVWTERVGADTQFFRPAGHPQAGEAFRLTEVAA
jgi:Ni,Fe-hydrogenase III component G